VAIDTTNEQFALLSFGNTLAPQVLLSPSTLGQDDQQHLLWGYPGILWGAVAAIIIGFYLDMNTRLMAYLRESYSVSGGDLSTLVQRDLAARTGDMTARHQALIQDATDAMP
jgi:hypothetical protein